MRGKLGGLSDPMQIKCLSELARTSAEAKERMDVMVAATGLGSQPSSQQPTVGLIKPPPRSGSSTPVSQRPATAAERAAFPSTLYELVQPHLDAKLDRLAQPELDLRELQRQLDERVCIACRARLELKGLLTEHAGLPRGNMWRPAATNHTAGPVIEATSLHRLGRRRCGGGRVPLAEPGARKARQLCDKDVQEADQHHGQALQTAPVRRRAPGTTWRRRRVG